MVRTGNVIKHKKFMDVAFHVGKVRGPYGPNGRVEITGAWINQGYVKSWILCITQKLILTDAQIKAEWQVCLEPDADCFRHVQWKDL